MKKIITVHSYRRKNGKRVRKHRKRIKKNILMIRNEKNWPPKSWKETEDPVTDVTLFGLSRKEKEREIKFRERIEPKKVQKRMGWNIEEARNRFSKAELKEISPRQFLDIALPKLSKEDGTNVYGFKGRKLTEEEERHFLSRPSIKDKRTGEYRTGTLDELGDLITSKDTKVQVPFLMKSGHEGRHRAKAAEMKGVEKIPVLFVEDV